MVKDFNLENVKEVYKMLEEITSKYHYSNFEVAFLIMERLDNIIGNADEITEDLVEKVWQVADNDGSLLADDILYGLEDIERELEEEEEK